MGVDHSFYLDAEDEESEFNTPQNFENHEGPPELRLPKYKRDGMFYPRRRFNILRQDEAVFKVAFDKFMAKYGGL